MSTLSTLVIDYCLIYVSNSPSAFCFWARHSLFYPLYCPKHIYVLQIILKHINVLQIILKHIRSWENNRSAQIYCFYFLSIFAIKIKTLSWKKYGLVLNTLTTTALPRNQPTDLPPPPYYTTTQTNRTAFFKSKVYRIPTTRFSDVYHSVYQYSD